MQRFPNQLPKKFPKNTSLTKKAKKLLICTRVGFFRFEGYFVGIAIYIYIYICNMFECATAGDVHVSINVWRLKCSGKSEKHFIPRQREKFYRSKNNDRNPTHSERKSCTGRERERKRVSARHVAHQNKNKLQLMLIGVGAHSLPCSHPLSISHLWGRTQLVVSSSLRL